jgi:uncharacterized protein YcfJ
MVSACIASMLAGCAATPMGPMVQVMPGPGKSFDTFQADQAACKMYAENQVSGQAEAANNRAVAAGVLTTVVGAGLGAAIGGAAGDAGAGAAIGAAAGAGTGAAYGAGNSGNEQMAIQQRYDNAFSQCMYAKGERVPGYAPITAVPQSAPVAMADPMVRAAQSELIRLGYLHDTADGFIGPKTRAAISAYQQTHGLPVDGTPSPTLVAKLQSTPTSAPPAATTASAPAGWVAPAGSPGAAPAASSGWVAPAKTP